MNTCLFSLALAAALLASTAAGQTPAGNFDESKVGVYKLPDPLVFNNGKAVRTAKDWNKRRLEILGSFTTNVFGRSPAAPRESIAEVFETDEHALGGKAIRKQITVYFSADRNGPKEDLLLYIPVGAKQPIPAVLSLNFFGNHSVTNDPAVKLATIWAPKTHIKQQAPENSRGRDTSFDIEKILARGYAFATICYQDIEPDFQGGYASGIRPVFLKRGQTQAGPDEWGAIGAWSYGLSRGMDYLEKEKGIDSHRVIAMGHSRLGKAILWAGASDTRFAMVLASCSGEGGASLYRRHYGETIKNLVTNFPYWFDENYAKFADDVSQLPVDAHELIALQAPRPVYITGAEDDQWADPKGEFLACVAAGPVYRLLGKQDLGTDQMPVLNQPIMHDIAFHYRTGKHAVTAFDWDQFLVFADLHLKR